MLDPNLSLEQKRDLFNRAKDAYYNGEEIISDADYDQLEKELGLENKSYIGSKKGNYTQKHSFIMGSLAKVQIKEDKKTGEVNWEAAAEKITKYLNKSKGTTVYETTPKLDGCSFSLEFKNDNNEAVLISCSTRGDGAYRTDIYKWFEKTLYGKYWDKIDDAVTSICEDGSNDILCIRGEVLVPHASFKESYQDFANPRAFVAGCINSKWEDKKEQKEMSGDLHFVCYDYRFVDGISGKFTEISWMNPKDPTYKMIAPYLNHIGELPDEAYCQVHNYRGKLTVEELQEIYSEYDDYRRNISPYALDGIVFKPAASSRLYNDKKERPDDCIAMKFMPMMEGTEIIDIKWTCGKDGEYTPIAYINPIYLDGKEVKKASMHNYNYVMTKHVGIGSIVRVSMAGDIIPYIYEIVEAKGCSDEQIKKPEDGYVETDPKSGNMHLMKQFTDDGKMKNSFVASAKTLNINGIGPAMANTLWDALHNIVNPLTNLVQLINKRDTIIDTLGNTKSIRNICDALRDFREHMTLEDIIASCCFKSCGERASQVCAKIIRGEVVDTTSIPGVAYQWALDLNSPEIKMVKEFADELGVSYDVSAEGHEDDEQDRIPIIMTGSPSDITDFKTKDEWLKAHPQYVNTTSWKECKILFTDDLESNSGKMKKAKQNGVEIRLYENLQRMYESEDKKIPIIMTGSPADVTDYETKEEWLKAHPEYTNTTSWKECKILFTNDLDSDSGKMKKAKENGVEIRLYESQEYTHDDMECLRVIAEGELDFLNQEWVINWNETDLIDYVNGDREPNYLYLVKAILADCERELSSNKEVKELLTAYPNTEYKEDIEIALLRAMQEYIKDIM